MPKKVALSRSEGSDPLRKRKTLVLSVEAIRRLEVASAMEGLDDSEIVEELINRRLGVYVVQVRGTPFSLGEDRRAAAGDVSPAASAVA